MSAKNLIAQLLVSFQLFGLIATLRIEVIPQAKDHAPETIFSNTQPISIPSSSIGTAPIPSLNYPSMIDVSGMAGNITRVAVTLNGLSHNRSGDVDLLLVSPSGAKFIFMADAGGQGPIDDKLLTFADDAPTTMSILSFVDVPSGSYKPTSGDSQTDVFPSPAPPGPYLIPPSSTLASAFNGASPIGQWALFAVDDSLNAAGAIENGWSLTITTDAAPATTFTNSSYIYLHDQMSPSAPYGSAINVTGQTGVISNIKVGLVGFSHARVDDVDILLVSPNGKGVEIMSDAGPASTASNADITFDDTGGIIPTSSTVVSGVYRPMDNSDNGDYFPTPAPLRPYHVNTGTNALSNFNGYSPNGEWRLYVMDDSFGSNGSISGGWFLDITTSPVSTPPPLACGAPAFSPTSFGVGANPTNLTLADFNNDTKTDVAVTNQVSNTVSVLLGNGTGTFMPQTQFVVGSSPYALVAGRFNADANFDLAVVNSGSNNVSILLGNGNGTFGAPTNFLVGPSPLSIATGDLNNDGNLDLAVVNFGNFFGGTVSILLGNGAGSFTATNSVRTRSQPSFVAIANLNTADSNRDLVVTSFGANTVQTFFGNGTGTFVNGQSLLIGLGPVFAKVTEVGVPDGFPDLLIANYDGDSVTSCVNSGSSGSFTCLPSSPVGGPNPISIANEDFVGSGTKTPAIALSGSNRVNVAGTDVIVGANPYAVESADFNGDGRPDLITANSGSNDVTVALNSCTVASGNRFDWDGDRRTDFNVFRPSTQAWYNYSLSQGSVARFFSRPGDQLVPADYDGDGKTDYGLYRSASGVWMVQNGQIPTPIYSIQFGIAEDIPTPGDFDGDRKADLAVFRPSAGTWYVRRSTDNSTQVIPFGSSGDKPVAADFDGDTKADVAVFRPSTGTWYILQSSNGQVVITQFGANGDKTVVGDYDGDRKADIAVYRPSQGAWWILWSSDATVHAFIWGDANDYPVPGDYDSDGKFDAATWRPSDRTWYIVKSSDGLGLYFQWGISTDYPVPNAYVR